MTEALAVLMATLMIPAAPLDSVMPETYSGYGETIAYVQQADVETGFVFTPKGSEVPVTYPLETVTDDNVNSGSIYCYFLGGNYNGKYYDGYYYNLSGELVTLKDKYISRVYEPTTTYNSKAFAFYMYWAGVYSVRPCSMSSYDKYIEDKSYVFVDEPQVNDIVLYFSSNSDELITAGVVTDVYESEASDPVSNEPFVKQLSKLIVQSKWSLYGVYEHRGDLCPFVGKYSCKYMNLSATAKVQYLRRHTTCNFKTVSGSDNGTTHNIQCTECGATEQKSHSYDYSYSTLSNGLETIKHQAHCACGASKIEKHSMVTLNIGSKTHTFCSKCYWEKADNVILSKNVILAYLQNKQEQ